MLALTLPGHEAQNTGVGGAGWLGWIDFLDVILIGPLPNGRGSVGGFVMLDVTASARFIVFRVPGLFDQRAGDFDVMRPRPGQAFLSGEAAAVLPAIGCAHAAATALLAGKRSGQVFGGKGRQGQAEQRNELTDQRQPARGAPAERAEQNVEPP